MWKTGQIVEGRKKSVGGRGPSFSFSLLGIKGIPLLTREASVPSPPQKKKLLIL